MKLQNVLLCLLISQASGKFALQKIVLEPIYRFSDVSATPTQAVYFTKLSQPSIQNFINTSQLSVVRGLTEEMFLKDLNCGVDTCQNFPSKLIAVYQIIDKNGRPKFEIGAKPTGVTVLAKSGYLSTEPMIGLHRYNEFYSETDNMFAYTNGFYPSQFHACQLRDHLSFRYKFVRTLGWAFEPVEIPVNLPIYSVILVEEADDLITKVTPSESKSTSSESLTVTSRAATPSASATSESSTSSEATSASRTTSRPTSTTTGASTLPTTTTKSTTPSESLRTSTQPDSSSESSRTSSESLIASSEASTSSESTFVTSGAATSSAPATSESSTSSESAHSSSSEYSSTYTATLSSSVLTSSASPAPPTTTTESTTPSETPSTVTSTIPTTSDPYTYLPASPLYLFQPYPNITRPVSLFSIGGDMRIFPQLQNMRRVNQTNACVYSKTVDRAVLEGCGKTMTLIQWINLVKGFLYLSMSSSGITPTGTITWVGEMGYAFLSAENSCGLPLVPIREFYKNNTGYNVIAGDDVSTLTKLGYTETGRILGYGLDCSYMVNGTIPTRLRL